MRISNGAPCNTHRAHAAQIKLTHIDLNKGQQSYGTLAFCWQSWQIVGSFSDFLLSSKNCSNFFYLSDHRDIFFILFKR